MFRFLALVAWLSLSVAASELRTTATEPLVANTSSFFLECKGEKGLKLFHDDHEVGISTDSSVIYSISVNDDIAVITIRSRAGGVAEASAGRYNCSDAKGFELATVTVVSVKAENRYGDQNATSVELSCSVDGTRNSGYRFGRFLSWYRNGTELKNGSDSGYAIHTEGFSTSLNVTKLNASFAGEYNCTVEVYVANNSQPVNVSQIAKLFWQPHIEPFGKQRSRVEDETADIECLVSGYPTPNVSWMLQREEGGAYVPVEYEKPRVLAAANARGVPNARLTVQGLRIDRDRGTYMCLAFNDYGSVNATVSLKVKDKLAAVWPFLGICAEVAVLCSIIFIFEKRRNKKLEEEEEVEAVKQELLNHPGRENEENKESTEMRKRPVKA